MVLENYLLWISLLIFVSVVSSTISDRFSIPVLLVFLSIGMIAGSEGPGGIYFDNAGLAKSLGTVALIFIIFSGGLDTQWKETKSVLALGAVLSTLGVLLTAILMGLFSMWVLNFSFLQGMLLGSIVSSTDAAAVFTVLRSRRMGLKKPLKPLLELESGSNDPMAVFLTLSFIRLLTVKDASAVLLAPLFFLDMSVGAAAGLAVAWLMTLSMRRLKLEYEGLYPVIMISLVLLAYSTAVFFRGNGFLAVYVAGLMLARNDFSNKRMIMRFHDGLAWLMQIAMFVTLGLLVFPSHLVPLVVPGLLLTLLLMLVARPLSVFLCMMPFRLPLRQKTMVAWVGLRGSVPIILATFPFMAGIPQADTIFNVVFFVVIASVFIQGTSIPMVSKWLKLDVTVPPKVSYPIEFEKTEGIDAELTDLLVPYDSEIAGKRIGELRVPEGCLIVLLSREGKFIVPTGSVSVEGGDVLLVLASREDLAAFQRTIGQLRKKE